MLNYKKYFKPELQKMFEEVGTDFLFTMNFAEYVTEPQLAQEIYKIRQSILAMHKFLTTEAIKNENEVSEHIVQSD